MNIGDLIANLLGSGGQQQQSAWQSLLPQGFGVTNPENLPQMNSPGDLSGVQWSQVPQQPKKDFIGQLADFVKNGGIKIGTGPQSQNQGMSLSGTDLPAPSLPGSAPLAQIATPQLPEVGKLPEVTAKAKLGEVLPFNVQDLAAQAAPKLASPEQQPVSPYKEGGATIVTAHGKTYLNIPGLPLRELTYGLKEERAKT